MVTSADLPRWRGFNLLEKFMAHDETTFRETDFEWISDWGFDFVRLPMDYRCWTGEGWRDFQEETLREIDQAVEYGQEYGIHVNLNFHRGPGYTVADPPEPTDLWTDEKAQDAFIEHWRMFADRYDGIPGEDLSFDLINEPADTTYQAYAAVIRTTVEAIHGIDPDRLVFADGMNYGREPVHELADTDMAQATRGYDPMPVSHYKASWVNGEQWDEPTWPLETDSGTWDRDRLCEERIEPWQELEAEDVGVHVGEWGAYCHTPHSVVLDWMEDYLELWEAAGWGWALWNFRGPFGVLDSEREDVDYEDWHGHSLDRRMLELLQSY